LGRSADANDRNRQLWFARHVQQRSSFKVNRSFTWEGAAGSSERL
jgi:hypothetical protein